MPTAANMVTKGFDEKIVLTEADFGVINVKDLYGITVRVPTMPAV